MPQQPVQQLIKINHWMRKSTINFFNRNPDAVFAPGFLTLCHPMVVDIFSKSFEAVSRDTYFVTCRARMILSENLKTKVYHEEEVLGAETQLNTLIDSVHEWFDTRIAQGEQKLRGAGFDPDNIQRVCNNYETRSVTGAVTQYLDILAKADLYLSMLQFLWVTGEISDSQDEALRVKLNTEREVRQTLHGLSRASAMHYNNIRRLCNGIVEKRREERMAKALRAEERKKEKARHREKRLAEEKQNLSAVQNEMDGLSLAA